MARNLYDVGDRHPDESGAWLNEKQETRTRVVPIGLLLVALALAIAVALLLAKILPAHGEPMNADAAPMTITDQFALCDDAKGDACVLSASTYAWRGRHYHIADIHVPSATDARCPAEADRAQRGRAALAAMLNGGAFEARPDTADPDPSARLLLRDGVSIGQLMILKGHAKAWSRTPINWCAG
ncbi:nuclease [Sphingobium cupriresistens]|uniref:Nuclease n=1 Tax=Sphingobium cupriresistens TaxID=1132417 RepID=A0A8G1ZF37_9SPHN|nr:nuclease [Sphingobium cupriresistens]RYM07793.1 nuclease [Sphingobium cupriresistens]